MMNFIILPDWNSLDSVRQAHSNLEAGGLIFFALLVVAEAVSHTSKSERRKHVFDTFGIWFFAIAVVCEIVGFRYGQRNDELSGQVISSLSQMATQAKENAKTALTDSATAATQSQKAMTKAGAAVKEADTFETGIVSAKRLAADAESHLADALQRAAQAESESAKAQAELTRMTGPPYNVPVIHGIATPDISKGNKQIVLLTRDTRVMLPTLPKDKSFSWTLSLIQDDVGGHHFTFSPAIGGFDPNVLSTPRIGWLVNLQTDSNGTRNTGLGGTLITVPATIK
ncbi:MAG TPA: hypothetical protein VGG18_07390 [Granulicella sp.]|jgi:hypothetical protein